MYSLLAAVSTHLRSARVAVDRQLEEVGALEEALDTAGEGPRLQVRRRVERDPPLPVELVVHGHHPALRCLVPEQPRDRDPECLTTGLPSNSVHVIPRSFEYTMHSPRPVLV